MRSEVRRSLDRPPRRDDAYQLELGGKSLLVLFCAAAIVCGMFFAFGYTLGKHAIPATFTLGQNGMAAPTVTTAPAPNPGGVQPPNPAELGQAETNQTPQSLLPGATPNPVASAGTVTAGPVPGASSSAPAPVQNGTAATSGAPVSPSPPATAVNPSFPPANANSTSAASSGSNLFQVQVFAGGKADADSLATALQKRGYPVNVMPPQPGEANLYRVQVGPYLTSAEAQAMRARLTADGYQAIVK